jgi:hypothetical protein
VSTITGTWYPPSLGTGGFLVEGQLFTNPPFHPMTDNITETLQERGKRYGKFSSHALITQDLKAVIAGHTPRGKQLPDGTTGDFLAADQQEALDMICHKIGRIINGDPDYADSWHDIAGYAQLVADRLNGVER